MDDDLEEFDADKFFGIKEEAFESGLSFPQEQMMQQMLQMMSQPVMSKRLKPQQEDSGLKLPPISKNSTVTSNMNELMKPKAMGRSNQDYAKRPPSSHSNALSEIEMNDSRTSSFKGGLPGIARRNNLVSGPAHEEEQKRPPHRVPSISASFKDD
jgi:hypothetical protein